jgi:hypothetical protein
VQFTHLASFASSSSGWITGDLFAMFAIDFCAQLSVYRLTLPPEMVHDSILLILDGHPTRGNLLALLIFSLFNVDVLILPGHTTHVLQALDVVINSPLKAEFKRLLMAAIEAMLSKGMPDERSKADVLRCQMVSAFLDAFAAVTTPKNLYKGFEATGFSPFNPDRPHESPFLANTPVGLFEGVAERAGSVNAQLLTAQDALEHRFLEQMGRTLTDQDAAGINFDKAWRALMSGTLEGGRALTQRPKIWLMTAPTTINALE